MSPDDGRGTICLGGVHSIPLPVIPYGATGGFGEADFHLISESIPHIVWVAGANGTIEHLNREGIEYAGHPLDSRAGWGWLSLVHPEDTERARRDLELANRTASSYKLEYRIRRADGQYRSHEFRRLPLRRPDGRVARWIGIAIDIEEQKQLEAQSRRSLRDTAKTNRLLETLLSTAPVGFGFVDLDFRIVRINETLAAINGGSIEQQIGRTVAEVVPHLWPRLESIYRQVLETRQPIVNQEASGKRKSEGGRLHHWLASYYPVCLDQDVIGIGVLAVDITERKEAEHARSQLFHALVAAIAATIEARDPYTAGHQRRVAQISVAIATEIGLDPDAIEGIRIAAEIHDLGKIAVPAEILARPARLSAAEYELVKSHPRAGFEITRNIPFPWPVADMILQHHERLDGSGYPAGLRGDQILIGARVIGVADVVEAIASHRPYRAAKGIQAAIDEIERGRGTLYDPDVADACLRLARQGRLHSDEPG